MLVPPKNEEAPAAVGSSGEGGYEACTNDATSQKSKPKLGNLWFEGSRYLFRSRPNGSTVFDTWKWTGEPPLQRTCQ